MQLLSASYLLAISMDAKFEKRRYVRMNFESYVPSTEHAVPPHTCIETARMSLTEQLSPSCGFVTYAAGRSHLPEDYSCLWSDRPEHETQT